MHSITVEQLNRIVSLLQSGQSIRSVAQQTKVSYSTVAKYGRIHCSDRNAGKGGRPKKLSEADKRYCIRQVTKGRIDNAVKVQKQLYKDLGVMVSAQTIRRTFREGGLGSIEKPKKPAISQANAKKRLAWCMAHKDWTIADWKRVIWSDETKVNRYNSDGRVWAWIRDGEQPQPRHVKGTVKHSGGSVMVWSAISYAGTGWLCKIEVNMDKHLYKEILEDELDKTVDYVCGKLNLRRDQVIYQQDNDSKHTSDVAKEYLASQEYQVMSWPAQSPDLNPIENMWRLLKIRLNEYNTPPRGINELYERIIEIWYNKITIEECRKVIEIMPDRIQQCIKAKGYWTDY